MNARRDDVLGEGAALPRDRAGALVPVLVSGRLRWGSEHLDPTGRDIAGPAVTEGSALVMAGPQRLHRSRWHGTEKSPTWFKSSRCADEARSRRQWCSAVAGVSIEILTGQTYAVVGETGSGKSTLARAIIGAPPPKSGQVLIAGEELSGSEALRSPGGGG